MIFFPPLYFFWLPRVYSWVRRGFRWTHLYPSLPIGIWWKCSVFRGEVEGSPCFFWFKCHTSCLWQRDELLIWRSQLSLLKSLSTLLQMTEKCHVRNLLFQSIRPPYLLPCQHLLWSCDGSFLVQSSRSQKDKPEKMLKVLGKMGAWPLLCGISCHWKCFYVMTRRTT